MASKDQVFEFARQEAIRQGVSPDLVVSMVKTESGGRFDAVSSKGARGPMQLMPATAKELGVDVNNWQDNIRGGVKYINQMMRQFNDPVLAVAAYNAGPGNVRKAGGVPEFKETQNYVKKVLGENMATQETRPGLRRIDPSVFGNEQGQAQELQQASQGLRRIDPSVFQSVADQAPVQQQDQSGSNLTRSLLNLGRQIAQNLRPGGFIGNPEVTVDRQVGIANEMGRQAGLFGRMGLEGVGTALDIGGAPISNLINMATGAQTTQPPSASMARIADTIGLPKPQGQFEESVQNIGKTGVAAMSGVGAGRLLAGPAQTGLSGMTRTQAVGTGLATQPGAQLAGAGTGATAVEGARNVYDVQDPYALTAIGLLGNVAGAGTTSRLGNVQTGAQYRDPVTGQLIEAGRARGVQLNTGDVGAGGGTLRSLRNIANTTEGVQNQRKSEVSRLIDRTATNAQPAGLKAGDEAKVVAKDLRDQYKAAKAEVKPLFDRANQLAGDQKISINSSKNAVQNVIDRFPDTSDTNIIMRNIERLKNVGDGGASYGEIRDISSNIGAELARVRRGVPTGAYNEKQQAALESLVKSIENDVDAWAAPRQINGRPVYTPAGAAHERAMEVFKERVVPFRADSDIYKVASTRSKSQDYDEVARSFIDQKLLNSTERAELAMNLMTDKGRGAAQFRVINSARSAATKDVANPSVENFTNKLNIGSMDDPTPQRVIFSKNPSLLDEVSVTKDILNATKPSLNQVPQSQIIPMAGTFGLGSGLAYTAGFDPLQAGIFGALSSVAAPRSVNALDQAITSQVGTRFMLGQPNLGTAGATGIAAQQLNPMGNEMPGNVLDLVVNPTIIPRGR